MEQKNNTGAIFKNNYKKTIHNQTKALIDGVEKVALAGKRKVKTV